MPLDAQTQAFLDAVNARPQPAPGEIPIDEFRLAMRAFEPYAFDGIDLPEVRDVLLRPPDAEPVRARIYRPDVRRPAPIVVWAHGGSWVRCDLETHDRFFRFLAHHSRCIVLAVDYRLAPEHRFPSALNDVYGAARWAFQHGARIGGEDGRVAIGGESSGGNLAAAATLLARMHRDFELAGQVLVLPVLDATFRAPSWDRLGDGYLLTRPQLEWAVSEYAPRIDRRDPLLSPLLADSHADLPPALVVTGEYDPLRDDGERYAAALSASGVPVEHVCHAGLIHHAMLAPAAIELGRAVIEDTARRMAAALGAPEL